MKKFYILLQFFLLLVFSFFIYWKTTITVWFEGELGFQQTVANVVPFFAQIGIALLGFALLVEHWRLLVGNNSTLYLYFLHFTNREDCSLPLPKNISFEPLGVHRVQATFSLTLILKKILAKSQFYLSLSFTWIFKNFDKIKSLFLILRELKGFFNLFFQE